MSSICVFKSGSLNDMYRCCKNMVLICVFKLVIMFVFNIGMNTDMDNSNVENPEEFDDMKSKIKMRIDVQMKLQERLKTEGVNDGDAKFLSSCVKGMDNNNFEMAKVWAEKGVDEAVKQMFVNPENGQEMGYAEMRSFYG